MKVNKSCKLMSILLLSLLLFNFIGLLIYKYDKTEMLINGYEIEKAKLKFPLPKDPFILPEIEVKNDNVIITEDVGLRYLGEFLLTGYCDCPICQEEWVGTTALGVPPTEEWTVAVDHDVIPLGSYVWIDGHRYRAEDVGGAIQENHIDMFMPSHEECYQDICNGYKEVYIEEGEK